MLIESLLLSVGFNKNKASQPNQAKDVDFKTVLKRKRWVLSGMLYIIISSNAVWLDVIYSKIRPKLEQTETKEGEIDPKFWELLMSADKKDYELICSEFGVTDFRWMLKKLNEMKKEREEEQAEVWLLTICR